MRPLAKHVSTVVLVLLVAVAASPLTAHAEDALELTPDEIVVIDRALDGARVRATGEAIGEDLHADMDHRWVNLLGDTTAIGVYVTNESAEQIAVYGDHTHRGATVQVVGTVNIACEQHGGEFDIHAEEFEIVAKGQTIDRPVAPWKGIAGLIAVLVAFVEIRLLSHLRERDLT